MAATPQPTLAQEDAPPAPSIAPGTEPSPETTPLAEPPPPPTPPAAPAPQAEPDPAKATGTFSWKPEQIDGRDYISLTQVREFYRFVSLEQEGERHVLRSAQLMFVLGKDSHDIRINNVKLVLQLPVRAKAETLWISRQDISYIIDPVLRPKWLRDVKSPARVIIDAGHGGEDTGATGLLGKESAYTLDTARRLQQVLESQGWKVVMTRTDDSFVPIKRRVEIANMQANAHPTEPAVFISLHFNAHTASHAGLETYVPGASRLKEAQEPDAAAVARQTASMALGTAVHANCLHRLKNVDGGVRGRALQLFAELNVPAILVEGGYVSNKEEGARIHTPEYRQSLAEAIAGGLANYRKAVLSRNVIRQAK
jgi:N-acetylmuramoyl-L-alanine amidase